MKLVGIFSLASGGREDEATGTLHQQESILFRSRWERREMGDLMLGDQGFCSYGARARLPQRGMASVLRLHQARKVSFREGRRLGKNDLRMTWQKPAQRTDAWSHEAWDALPAELSLRRIRLPGQHARLAHAQRDPGHDPPRCEDLSCRRDSGARRAALAGRTAFSPDQNPAWPGHPARQKPGTHREGNPHPHIAYPMIRLLMQKAAGTHQTDLGRISFQGTLDTVRHFASAIPAARATPRQQDALIERMLATIASDPVPERPGRSEPRAKKRRPQNYHLLTKPRSKMQVPPHRNKPRFVIPKRP